MVAWDSDDLYEGDRGRAGGVHLGRSLHTAFVQGSVS